LDKISRIKQLVKILNEARNTYYNESKSIMSDYEYDDLFNELQALESETLFTMTNSPTISVGYEVKSKLEKVTHSHPMLSLDKTKSVDDLIEFASDENCLLMHKLDGLTVLLTYNNGELIQAETRGNGEVGEIITHNAKVFKNIPLTISCKEYLEIEGEAIIAYDDFNEINKNLAEDEKYKNPRNLVSGSVRQLDNKIAASRNIKYIAWKVPTNISNTMFDRLKYIKDFGFDIVPFWTYTNKSSDKENINKMIDDLRSKANELGYPIDGLVMAYNDITYGESLGSTGHHPKHSIAFKFYDEEVVTTLRNIEWSMGKTGQLTPVAIFDTVEIDGTEVSRASLHNLSIMKDLRIGIGDVITVYKANQIIPQIKECLTPDSDNFISIPVKCPICNSKTIIKQDNETEVLLCTNTLCKGKLLGKLTHFCSKNAMNIEGLSEETLKTLLDNNLIEDEYSIYELKDKKELLLNLDRFGIKKVTNLLKEIEKSKDVKLENFLYAWSIPLIGKTASKTISKYFNGDFYKFYTAYTNGFNFTQLDDFGSTMNKSIWEWMIDYNTDMYELAQIIRFIKQEEKSILASSSINGKSFCITGKLEQYPNRDSLVADIEKNGGKVVSGVTKKTDYLITNDTTSDSSKNKKARELNIPVISEQEFISLIK